MFNCGQTNTSNFQPAPPKKKVKLNNPTYTKCDSLPPEKCQPAKPKFKRRIVLKCTEIAEIPPDLYRSLNANL